MHPSSSGPQADPIPFHPLLADYRRKALDYYGHARTEIEPLLPAHAARVLEIGCGRGDTLAWLKAAGRCAHTSGIELFPEAAEVARSRVDHVEVGDAVGLLDGLAQRGPFDLVLCLDVLEHLVDPWTFVARLDTLLAPGGCVIASVPNVRHWRVSVGLLVQGRWRYGSAGVLDRTHLRFFTREGARELLGTPPLELAECRASQPPRGSTGWIANRLTAGLLADLFAVQYLLRAHKR